MFSSNRAVLSVAISIALSMGPPVMADLQDNCRTICRPKTCKVRISAPCTSLCINICSLDTLTPAPRASSPSPPCKPY
uniref:Uncharacterized protein n=1 Tax=Setaria italica TaxID=4555 RepID=K3ZKR0_SETIT